MRVPVSIRTSYFMADKKALVDSGATDNFMHPAFAQYLPRNDERHLQGGN
jgi:hypothetical protein